jgi:UPF0042 nucleotide-binding protein
MGQRVDTSVLTPQQLRGWIQDLVVTDRARLALCFQSFGYKGGRPARRRFRVRHALPAEPALRPELRPLSGWTPGRRVPRARDAGEPPVEDIQRFLQRWLPRFVLDQRASINVAIGCTGGRHRSVYVASQLAQRFKGEYQVILRHRD